MKTTSTCAICESDNWRTIGTSTFTPDNVKGSNFLARRRRVLFELWVPDAKQLVINYCLCESCGFVCYFPRPTAEDVDNKYQFLAKLTAQKKAEAKKAAKKGTAPSPQSSSNDDLGARRSAQIHETLSPFLSDVKELLDWGGGKGVMLKSFLDSGISCSVVDYVAKTLPGIERIGTTLSDIPEGRSFDLVIASHVFEHFAEPLPLARSLRKYLRPDGLLFIEVPLEFVGGAPKRKEPVTHLNFFCASSIRTLLERAGFEVAYCQRHESLFETGASKQAIRAIGKMKATPVEAKLPSSKEATALLNG